MWRVFQGYALSAYLPAKYFRRTGRNGGRRVRGKDRAGRGSSSACQRASKHAVWEDGNLGGRWGGYTHIMHGRRLKTVEVRRGGGVHSICAWP